MIEAAERVDPSVINDATSNVTKSKRSRVKTDAS